MIAWNRTYQRAEGNEYTICQPSDAEHITPESKSDEKWIIWQIGIWCSFLSRLIIVLVLPIKYLKFKARILIGITIRDLLLRQLFFAVAWIS
jgi:hypothetical protein